MTGTDRKKPLLLAVLDGWGYREDGTDNAIRAADTPTWDRLWREQPHTLISGSGLDVGLPDGQMGNSEVGHMSLGSGRIIYQSIARIDKAIDDGSFFDNAAYTGAVDAAMADDGAVHVLGLLSPGGVHSHENHLLAMVELAARRGCNKVYVHAFLDGRDTPPRSAKPSLERMAAKLAELGCGRIASITGRYYAMDRDNRWDRVEKAWQVLTEAETPYTFAGAVEGLEAAYERGEDDEFVLPTSIRGDGEPTVKVGDGDAVVFMNFRGDRAREITRAFVDADFDGFDRPRRPALAKFVMTTEYAADIDADVAFASSAPKEVLGEYLAEHHMTQLRIAETEKYAHVTFFFNGGREQPFDGEDRILVDSPKVATYDLQPEMSAPEVTDKLVEAIKSGRYDVIVCNYANGDMVGHTGIFDAAVKAAEAIDESLRRVTDAIVEVDGECLITADHGNCEMMVDATGEKHTQHTTDLVPFIYVGSRKVRIGGDGGRLCDVAPTMLALLGMAQPSQMTGHSLLELPAS